VKNILLSVVVMAVLVAGGIGGTLADFNDYEVSEDNYFQMGSMDLTVSDSDGDEYNGANIPTIVVVENGWPDCSKDRSWDLHNAGENEQVPPEVYIHFKNYECVWAPTKVTSTTPVAYIAIESGHVVKYATPGPGRVGINEPQMVAIFGGVAGENASGSKVTVAGINDAAICLLSRTLQVEIRYSEQYTEAAKPASWAAVPDADKHILSLSAYDDNLDGIITLNELLCHQIKMFDLKGCYSRWMNISLRAVDINESEFSMNYFGTDPAEAKWENWPTNAIQNQKLFFDMAFEMFGEASP